MSDDIEIRLHDKRAQMAERVQVVQDVASVIALLPAALIRIHSPSLEMRALAVTEFLAAAVLVIMTIRELRDGDDDLTGVSWTNLIVGALIITESLIQSHEHVSKVVRPALVTGLSSVFLGLLQGKLRKRRAGFRFIRISDERVHVRLGKFRQSNFAWSEIERIEDDGDVITLVPRTGKPRKIKLKRYDNGEDIRTAFRTFGKSEKSDGFARIK